VLICPARRRDTGAQEVTLSENGSNIGFDGGSYSMSRVSRGGLAITAALLISSTVHAQESAVQRGRTFAQTNCSRCHAIGSLGGSPVTKAPPFRTLHQRYPVEDLVESLAEGIRTAHPAMPQFELTDNQIHDLIAYLKSLENPAK
jgi:mono/diheme cytochrome c family protein